MFFATLKLDASIIPEFNESDIRRQNWVGYNSSKDAFFSHKYKIDASSEFPIKEYSMVLRLAEQYLIRAEARANLGKINDALNDLDAIRKRAGLPALTEITPGIAEEELMEKISLYNRNYATAHSGELACCPKVVDSFINRQCH